MISLVKLIFGAIGSSASAIPTTTRPTLYGSFSRRVAIATTAGFKGYTTQVTLAAGDRARVNAALALGQATETVTVESTTPALQTDESTIGTLITSEATQDLPLNGRNVLNLITVSEIGRASCRER